MSDVNWWLMALAFVLGLVLTVALTVRRVTREVPVYAALGRGPAVTAPTVELEGAAKAAAATGTAAAGAAKLTGASGEEFSVLEEAPFGAGSVRLASGSAAAPTGYTVKGNEDSMLYHTTESPSYEVTIAEIWFTDVPSAEKAGFNRWDSGKSQRGKK